ncbi:exosome complex exonuclease RRP4 [Pseudomassariella vexata]|uniref:Exosome complex exonuclease RRP4 n=1 Tax=Pseudomassariella vexata TaxID=1141098 RepID=A0A1Y2DUU3_9PEZI|nr:exosome complex exonuclease RRP4 [Pseudomassariella vexata]ORY63050.1 exosome complex exonuclease RRP4 [Pseudomassariella vexata]
MPITILHPAPVPFNDTNNVDPSDSDSDGGADLDGDISMGGRPAKRARTEDAAIVTPGEVITEDPQWMRGHGTYTIPDPPQIVSSVAGTLSKTNKLLSVRPLRARYTPEIGDLVVGRIVEVQAKRWRVDVGASLLAQLPLSAINLPGGIQRRRTETDELQIRTFFSEGELLVAEVQQLYGDGGAVLHTRSLKYGKLRNGVFVAVSGTGGGGGVVRARRQAFTLDIPGGEGGSDSGEKIDVVLGVNGYIWISKHVEGEGAAAETTGPGITRIEDSVGLNVYSSQNDSIPVDTMREIARVRGVITVLVENGLKVDEEMVTKGYQEAVEMSRMDREGEHSLWLGGERGKRLADALVGR